MNPRETITEAAPTKPPNMVEAMIARTMRRIMTSVHPALISVNISLRLITETERKTKNINITSTSITTVREGLIAFIAPTGLVSMISGEDQAHRVSARIENNAVSVMVIIDERTKALRSGVSSLTVFAPTLEPRNLRFTLKDTDRINIVGSMVMVIMT
jgi:hypothetical protein